MREHNNVQSAKQEFKGTKTSVFTTKLKLTTTACGITSNVITVKTRENNGLVLITAFHKPLTFPFITFAAVDYNYYRQQHDRLRK